MYGEGNPGGYVHKTHTSIEQHCLAVAFTESHPPEQGVKATSNQSLPVTPSEITVW